MELIETTVLNGQVTIFQPVKGGLRVTIDSIFCASACPAKSGETICDLGAGTGVVGLCAGFKAGKDAHLTFVEVQQDYSDLCLKNAFENRIEADSICADVRAFKTADKIDHVVCNPPYLEMDNHFKSPDVARQKALGEEENGAVLNDWISCAERILKHKGSLSLIHRADALDDILILLKRYKFGAIEAWPLYPYADKPAHRIIIRAYLGRKTKLTLHHGIIMHPSEGNEKYTDKAQAVLSGELLD